MKKAARDDLSETTDEMRAEYDFTGGVRGKHAARYAAGVKVRILNPRVVEARVTRKEIIASLGDGRRIAVPLTWYPKLARGTPDQRANLRLSDNRSKITWPDLGETISVQDLLTGLHPMDTSRPASDPGRLVRSAGAGEVRDRRRAADRRGKGCGSVTAVRGAGARGTRGGRKKSGAPAGSSRSR